MEGTTAHWLGEQILRSYLPGSTTGILQFCQFVGTVCPETSMVITEEMCAFVNTYVDHVLKVVNKNGALQTLWIEERVDIPQIHPQCWGTLDCAIYLPKVYTLIILDFKYGFNLVEPDSEQLMAYASGMVTKLNLPPETRIVLSVVQPRAYHRLGPVRDWMTTAGDLRAEINYIGSKVHEAMQPNPPATSGSHCRYCAYLPVCPTAREASYNAVQVSSRDNTADELDNARLAYELDVLEQAQESLKMRYAALEEMGTQRIKGGEVIPGYSCVPKYGKRKWLKTDEEVIALGNILGVDLSSRGTVTPAEAERLGVNKDMVKKLTETPNTGVKLKRDNHSIAKLIFSKEVN